ncbi:MAG: zf-HC2 domain-containing protein [Steroidobacteraceae bacterium]
MSPHQRADELMPWMVNGRLQGEERAWMEQHLAGCPACHAEYERQQQLRAALVREPAVAFAPQASFNRLWQRIEAEAAAAPRPAPARRAIAIPRTAAAEPAAARPARPVGTSRRWLAVAVAVQALIIGTLAAWLWQVGAAPTYRTVTSSPAAATAGPVVRAVFDDTMRLADFRALLDASGLRVAAGPTPAGVYTLAAVQDGAAELDTGLRRLRADPRVRFAEIAGP